MREFGTQERWLKYVLKIGDTLHVSFFLIGDKTERQMDNQQRSYSKEENFISSTVEEL